MQMTPFSNTDKQIALALIDAISEDGYLSCKLEEIQQALSKNLPVEIDEIEAVLHQIQNYDPLGVGARDLAECLRLQMKVLHSDTPFLKAATELATRKTWRCWPAGTTPSCDASSNSRRKNCSR